MKTKANDPYMVEYSQLIGKTVRSVDVETHTEDEFSNYALVFTDGTIAYIDCDPEGNGPGFLDIHPE